MIGQVVKFLPGDWSSSYLVIGQVVQFLPGDWSSGKVPTWGLVK